MSERLRAMAVGMPNADQRDGGPLAAIGRRSSPNTNTRRPDAAKPSTYTFDPTRADGGARIVMRHTEINASGSPESASVVPPKKIQP